MPLQATSGAASYDGFGGGVPFIPTYIEDVFSTWLYTGNGSTQTITNGIDLAGKGGLVWMKNRNVGEFHRLYHANNTSLCSNATAGQQTIPDRLSFASNGFNLLLESWQYEINYSGQQYASWTFRKQPKFFDVVTYTGNGAGTRTIAHSLGSQPGAIFLKRTDASGAWAGAVKNAIANSYWAGEGSSTRVFTTEASGSDVASDGFVGWTSTNFKPTSFGFNGTEYNINGATYVAYLFAHNAGGFGLTGTDNVISCGSFTTDGSGFATVNLGYEPQWVLIKRTDISGINWLLFDTMRGWTVSGDDAALFPNTSGAESVANRGNPTATGFEFSVASQNNGAFIYIAIRRGPMKTPTSGTSVFYPQAVPQAATPDSTGVPFPPDLVNTFSRNGNGLRNSNWWWFNFVDRLRGLGVPNNTFTSGGPTLSSSSTNAEDTGTGGYVQLKADGQNITRGSGWNQPTYGDWIYYFMRRAPGFFDVVCYTGTGSARTVNHNLGVAPEMLVVKNRTDTGGNGWFVYLAPLGNQKAIFFNSADAPATGSAWWNSTSPTSSEFTVGTFGAVNRAGDGLVAYLFASCPGVSKVGSYTGTGALQTVNCGFTGGARFVLIKRTDSTGDWYVWDSARGIVSGNDPYLLLNSTAAEVTNTDYIDTYSAGFEISSTAPAAINANGGSFIFLAIA